MKRIFALFNENRFLAYLLPIASIFLFTLVLFPIRTQMEPATVALLYFLPVGACAAVAGLGPGILAAVIAFFSLNYFFISPYGSLLVHKSQDLVALVVFLILAFFISQLVGRLIKSLAIAQAREMDTTRLYQLNQSLSRSLKLSEILEQVAHHCLETFRADQVEIQVRVADQSFFIRLPGRDNGKTTNLGNPGQVMPLPVSPHVEGEIRLWRSNHPFREARVHLLRSFAQQFSLALERNILAEQAQQAELLKATDKLQSSLLNSISHDLRTPLVSITGALSSLQEKSLSLDQEARASLLDTAIEEAERLNRLVGNLLNMTRLEAGGVRLHKESSDIQDVIGCAIEQLGERVAQREIRINLPAETVLLPLDARFFEQVMVNILDNAAKYSPSDTAIEIDVREEPGWTHIEVSDRGEGIPAEDLEHVFDKFFRVKRRQKTSGSGLGLAICKGIVEAHGGGIQAKNRTGGGTTLSITLPREAEA